MHWLLLLLLLLPHNFAQLQLVQWHPMCGHCMHISRIGYYVCKCAANWRAASLLGTTCALSLSLSLCGHTSFISAEAGREDASATSAVILLPFFRLHNCANLPGAAEAFLPPLPTFSLLRAPELWLLITSYQRPESVLSGGGEHFADGVTGPAAASAAAAAASFFFFSSS